MNKRYCSVNNWLIDAASGSILHLTTGERKRLGEYQLKLLDILAQDPGKIFTREELTSLVWDRVIGNNSLPNAIHALRTALEDDGKKQHIIKTIPRKGYLLEAEYCCVVERDEANPMEGEDSDKEEPAEIPPQLAVDPESAITVAEPHVEVASAVSISAVPAIKKSRYAIFDFLLVALITAFITASTSWYLFSEHRERLVAHEIQPGVYSNIHIYAIETTGDPAYISANLYANLKDSLYRINQQIKIQSVTMSAYFHSSNSSLNYTFYLSNKCDKKQLSMKMYYWRTDMALLNNLILRETRRKLNELATCDKN